MGSFVTCLRNSGDDAQRKLIEFSYKQLATATHSFGEQNVIGGGRFGRVYRGTLRRTGQNIAVKKLRDDSQHRIPRRVFREVITQLWRLDHPNLVDLIGYFAVGDKRYLVYELMPLGSLESQLYYGQTVLDWNTRMKIAVGAAKGLNYLHNEAPHRPLIFRGLKPSNILLDQEFNPKLCDFGLTRFETPEVYSMDRSAEGYCAPEYADTGGLTTKADVYSFGMFMLELIRGIRPRDVILADGSGTHDVVVELGALVLARIPVALYPIVDSRLQGNMPPLESLREAMRVALMCVQEDPGSRPDMNEVVEAMNAAAAAPAPAPAPPPPAVVEDDDEIQQEDEDDDEITEVR